MGKKLSQASTKISKPTDKKQLNSLIKVLKPKVYITDSSNFKKLVQELTGNGNPIPFPPPLPSLPVMELPIIEIEDGSGYQEHSSCLESSSVDSSEASMGTTSFTTNAAGSPQPQEVYVSETFNVLESCSWTGHKMDYHLPPNYGDIESWLLQIDDSCSYNCDQQEVSFCDLLSSLL